MIYGVGIDATEITRFSGWDTKPKKELLRIFSDKEIEYCLQIPEKSSERFAVRYAAREAFFKAYQSAYCMLNGNAPTISFLNICKHITITKAHNGIPLCIVNWTELQKKCAHQDIFGQLNAHISLSHTQTTATAIIILSPKP